MGKVLGRALIGAALAGDQVADELYLHAACTGRLNFSLLRLCSFESRSKTEFGNLEFCGFILVQGCQRTFV